jgi:hypothetical protein
MVERRDLWRGRSDGPQRERERGSTGCFEFGHRSADGSTAAASGYTIAPTGDERKSPSPTTQPDAIAVNTGPHAGGAAVSSAGY